MTATTQTILNRSRKLRRAQRALRSRGQRLSLFNVLAMTSPACQGRCVE